MIKKFLALLLMAVVMMAGIGISNANAATGATGSCGVSVWTDATTYSTSATTVDWKASKPSTTCGTVYYKMRIYQVGDGSVDIGYQTSGYFTTSTPIKSVYISDIKSRTPYPSSPATYKLVVTLYSSSSYTTSLGSAQSALFYIY